MLSRSGDDTYQHGYITIANGEYNDDGNGGGGYRYSDHHQHHRFKSDRNNNSNSNINASVVDFDSENSDSSSRSVARTTPLPISSLLFLTLLYSLQGLSLGLCTGSIPFLLQERSSMGDMAKFSLASYPYSLKLLWSPLVDAIFSPRIGRRKSWIIPMQLGIAVLMILLASSAGELLGESSISGASGAGSNFIHNSNNENDNDNNNNNSLEPVSASAVWMFTSLFLIVVTLTASQDIAVDGWAITMLPREHARYASTCQSVGITAGFFASFTVFLAMQQLGMATLPGFMRFCAFAYAAVSLLVWFWPEENSGSDQSLTVVSVYKDILAIVSLPAVRRLALLLLVWKLPFMAFDSVLFFRLVRKGFRKGKIASLALVKFPFEILFSVLAGKWSRGENPLRPVTIAYIAKVSLTLAGPVLLWSLPMLNTTADEDFPMSTYAIVMVISLASSFASTTIFVSQGSFFNRIADPVVGGTYMTALNTISNFGGTWPQAPILSLVHSLTQTECIIDPLSVANRSTDSPYSYSASTASSGSSSGSGPTYSSGVDSSLLPATCDTGDEAKACLSHGGICNDIREGYFTVSTCCIALGIAVAVILPRVIASLERTTRNAWLVRGEARSGPESVGWGKGEDEELIDIDV